MTDENLANQMSELIFERSLMARCDAEDLAWDLLRLVKGSE